MKLNERRQELVTQSVAKVMYEVLTKLLCIMRWSSYIGDYRYNELNKQALNAAITYFLAIEAQEKNKKIDMTRFPKIMFHRAFEKLFLCDIREDYIDSILKCGNIEREKFDQVVDAEITELLGEEFSKFIMIDKDWEETKIFQGATKLATQMELTEIKNLIRHSEYTETMSNIGHVLNGYSDLSGFTRISLDHSEEMTLFRQISALRNRIRWQKWLGMVKCSVLGHNFEVAVISYLMAIKKYEDERVATRCFFTGIFHDVPETFTGDMPSPVKDAVSGLRKATEYFELDMVNKNVYSKLRPYQRDALHKVMMEEQEGLKPLIKQADVLSATLECVRQIIAGSRDEYFKDVVKRDLNRKEKFYEPFYSMLKDICKDIL